MKKLLAGALALALMAGPALAQTGWADTDPNNPTVRIPREVSKTFPLPVLEFSGATAVTAASGNVANASAVATLAAASGKTTYITGFRCTAAGATAASVVSLTVAGVITGTMTYTFAFPAGVTTAATPVGEDFVRPVPASATNTAIVVTLPAGGSGNTNASCVAVGFQL